MRLGRALVGTGLVGLAAAALSCGEPTPAGPSASASVPPPPPEWLGISRPLEQVMKEINPSGRPAYAGKTGTLRGRVTVVGDPPPATDWVYPTNCSGAVATYGRAFRVAADGGLADALVTVTGYDGFVPPTAPAVQVTAQNCAFDQKSYVATFGQRIEVKNVDYNLSYTPVLDGAAYRAINVALPQGSPIKL
jgi:hypothetical protein